MDKGDKDKKMYRCNHFDSLRKLELGEQDCLAQVQATDVNLYGCWNGIPGTQALD